MIPCSHCEKSQEEASLSVPEVRGGLGRVEWGEMKGVWQEAD